MAEWLSDDRSAPWLLMPAAMSPTSLSACSSQSRRCSRDGHVGSGAACNSQQLQVNAGKLLAKRVLRLAVSPQTNPTLVGHLLIQTQQCSSHLQDKGLPAKLQGSALTFHQVSCSVRSPAFVRASEMASSKSSSECPPSSRLSRSACQIRRSLCRRDCGDSLDSDAEPAGSDARRGALLVSGELAMAPLLPHTGRIRGGIEMRRAAAESASGSCSDREVGEAVRMVEGTGRAQLSTM